MVTSKVYSKSDASKLGVTNAVTIKSGSTNGSGTHANRSNRVRTITQKGVGCSEFSGSPMG